MCECISGAIHLKIGESALGKGEALEWGRKWLLIAWIKTAVETESVEIDSGDNRLVRLAECELNESIELVDLWCVKTLKSTCTTRVYDANATERPPYVKTDQTLTPPLILLFYVNHLLII